MRARSSRCSVPGRAARATSRHWSTSSPARRGQGTTSWSCRTAVSAGSTRNCLIVYLHGFNSSPQSHKAQVMQRFMVERGLAQEYACPALPPLAGDALKAVEHWIERRPCFVGSSLGGFYATYLAEKHGLRAVLLNPAIDPHVGLRAYLGPHSNLHTGEPYQLTEAHLHEW